MFCDYHQQQGSINSILKMRTSSSTFRMLQGAWVGLTCVQLAGCGRAVYGSDSTSWSYLFLSAALFTRDFIDEYIVHVLEHAPVVQALLRLIPKAVTTRATSLGINLSTTGMSSTVLLLLFLAVNILMPPQGYADLPVRILLASLFVFKRSSVASLRSAVQLHNFWSQNRSAGAVSALPTLPVLLRDAILSVSCYVWLPGVQSWEHELALAAGSAAGEAGAKPIDGASLEHVLLSAASEGAGTASMEGSKGFRDRLGNPAVQSSGPSSTQSTPRGIPTLLAVLQFSAVEAGVSALGVSVPLLAALCEPLLAVRAEGGAVAYGRLFSVGQAATIVAAAALCTCSLAFAAAYLQYRTTIHLESRGSLRDGAQAGTSPVGGLVQGWLAVLDCDARTVCFASRGALCTSRADQFACGALSAAAGAAAEGCAGSELETVGESGAGPRGKGGKTGPAARPASVAGAQKGLTVKTPGGSAISSPAQPQSKEGQGEAGAAQSFVLNLSLLVVLAVAALQLALSITGVLGARAAEASLGTAVAELALVLLVRSGWSSAWAAGGMEGNSRAGV